MTASEHLAAGPTLMGSDLRGLGAKEESTFRYVRSPQDVLRLVAFLSTTLVLVLLSIGIGDSILQFEEDLIKAFGSLTPAIARVVQGTLTVAFVLVVAAINLVALITKRYRLFGCIAGASMLAFGLMWLANYVIDRGDWAVLINQLAHRAGLDTSATSTVSIAQLAAMFVVVGPFVSRQWRRAGAIIIGVLLVATLLVLTELPVDVFLALPLGATCGTLVLRAFGRPDRRPTLEPITPRSTMPV